MQAASAPSPEQLMRDFGGSFSSVRNTLLHILQGEWIWLRYWQAQSHRPEDIAEMRAEAKKIFEPDLYPDIETIRVKWIEIETEQSRFVEGISEAELTRVLPYRTTELPISALMQHVVNHSTYHRGQVTWMLRQLGAEPVATDFHVFLAESRLAAGTSS